MKEYGKKPYLAKSYWEMINKTSNSAMWNQIKAKHSEMEKPYRHKAGEYPEMQHYYPNLPGMDDLRFDHPWMGRPVDDAKKMNLVFFGGCGLSFPGLWSTVAKCEIRCVYLDKWYTHKNKPGGAPIPDDPIVSWSVTGNAVIVASSIWGACVKVNEDATEGDIVRITATTKSGDTCNSSGWISDDDCWNCSMSTISYTTLGMAVDETQDLSVAGAGPKFTYGWSLASGGGSLSDATGQTTTYTAPSTNANCVNNPTITLSCDGDIVDSITIAVNASAILYKAYENTWITGTAGYDCSYSPYSCPGQYCGPLTYFTCAIYRCDNTLHSDCDKYVCEYADPGGVWEDKGHCNTPTYCGAGKPLGITDIRTEEMKTAGCCPEALI